MNHIIDTCPLTKFEGGLNLLHEVDDDAVIWLEPTATAALAKNKTREEGSMMSCRRARRHLVVDKAMCRKTGHALTGLDN